MLMRGFCRNSEPVVAPLRDGPRASQRKSHTPYLTAQGTQWPNRMKPQANTAPITNHRPQ